MTSATTTPTKRTTRRRKGAEEFFVETITLQPITIQDPTLALMETSEAAEILDMRRPNVTQLMDRGGLTVVRRSGSGRRWLLRGEVEGLAARRKEKAA